MKNKKYNDVMGSEIKPGDWIVYGSLKGRCAGLNIGRVIQWETVDNEYSDVKLRMKVDAIIYSWGEWRRAGVSEYGDRKKPVPVRLDFSDRVCVIPESIVPEHIRGMLA